MQSPYDFVKDEDKSKTVKSSSILPEVKVEIADEFVESEEICNDGKVKVNLGIRIKNMKYTCPYCTKKFDTKCNLKNHMIIHSNVYQYKCSICGLCLKTLTLLKSHSSLHKKDMVLFHCVDCDFKSVNASSIKYHQIKCHATNIYKCQFCSELFQSKTFFLKHMKLHTACDMRDHTREDNNHFT